MFEPNPNLISKFPSEPGPSWKASDGSRQPLQRQYNICMQCQLCIASHEICYLTFRHCDDKKKPTFMRRLPRPGCRSPAHLDYRSRSQSQFMGPRFHLCVTPLNPESHRSRGQQIPCRYSRRSNITGETLPHPRTPLFPLADWKWHRSLSSRAGLIS